MKTVTKKPYVKADITLVDFSLSSSIASSCTLSVDSDKTYTFNGLVYFTSEIEACEVKLGNKDEAGICYHVPTDDTKVFAS